MPEGNMKRILCFDWLPKRARWTHLVHPRLPALTPPKKKRNYLERDFWTMSATESQKAAEDIQNKENINDSRGFIGSQKQMVFFSISRNKQVSILIKRQSYCYRQSFCYIINPSLTKLVRSRWLNISRGVFSVFMDRDEPHAWLIKHFHSTLKCLPGGGVVKWIMYSDLLRQNRMLLRY